MTNVLKAIGIGAFVLFGLTQCLDSTVTTEAEMEAKRRCLDRIPPGQATHRAIEECSEQINNNLRWDR